MYTENTASDRPDHAVPAHVSADAQSATQPHRIDELVRFYKALADPTRLRLVGLLAVRPMYGQELAAALDVKPATVSHHLGELRGAGLLRERKVDNYRYFELDTDRLRQLSGTLLAESPHARRAPRSDERTRVVSTYLVGGRLTAIPSQRKRLLYLLEELVTRFAYDRRYTEAEVNGILGALHEDVATLRRELIGCRLLARERGIYWRIADRVGNGAAS